MSAQTEPVPDPALGYDPGDGRTVDASGPVEVGRQTLAEVTVVLRAEVATGTSEGAALGGCGGTGRRRRRRCGDPRARAVADAIAARFRADHDRLAAEVAALLGSLDCVSPLLHGSSGALWGAGVGTGLEAVVQAHDDGAAIRRWVAEGRPWLDGSRVALWELVRRGVVATLVSDAAAAGTIAAGRVDLVLRAADRVATDGSVSLPVGAYGLAVVAARHGIPFAVCAAPWSLDPAAPPAAALTEPPAPASALTRFAGAVLAPPEAAVDATRFDVVPLSLITHLATVPPTSAETLP